MINLFKNASPLRRRFFRDLLLLVLITACVLGTVVFFLRIHLRNDLCRNRIRHINLQAEKDFNGFFKRVETSLDIARKWGEAGLLTTSDVAEHNAKFIPILESLPGISALIIAEPNGSEYLLTHDAESWLTIVTGSEGPGRRSIYGRWGRRGTLLKQWTRQPSYDPRSRPWYRDALSDPNGERIVWTQPYTFADGKIGVSAAVRWKPESRDGAYSVIAFDVPLDNILKIVAKIPVGTQGTAFLVSGTGKVLVEPAWPVNAGTSGPFQISAMNEKPQVTAAVATWLKTEKPVDIQLPVHVEDESWWSGFHRLAGETFPIWLGVVAPVRDLLGDSREGRRVVILSVLAILGLGGGLATFLAFRYSRHLRESHRPVIERNDPEPGLRALIAQGESATLEFKSTVRMNLKSGKPGKEIELAWLKALVAFMNTGGGSLLIGVDDRGDLVGISVDGFENGDKCLLHLKNLFARHIGAEFSRHVSFELFTVVKKQVVLVECERSKEPIFLINGNEEEFYIRTGPANVRLSMSKAFKYLTSRKSAA